MRRFLLYWLPALVWMGVVFAASAQPQLPEIGEAGSPLDQFAHKAAHIAVFAVLTGLYYRLLGQYLPVPGDLRLLAVSLAVIYGLGDELHQMLVPGRNGRLVDVAVDAVGCGAAMLLLAWLERRLPLLRRMSGAR